MQTEHLIFAACRRKYTPAHQYCAGAYIKDGVRYQCVCAHHKMQMSSVQGGLFKQMEASADAPALKEPMKQRSLF